MTPTLAYSCGILLLLKGLVGYQPPSWHLSLLIICLLVTRPYEEALRISRGAAQPLWPKNSELYIIYIYIYICFL